MSEKLDDPLTARVAEINKAIHNLQRLAWVALVKNGTPEKQSTEIVDVLQATGVLIGSLVVSLSEIADSVGKIARQNEADFKAAVDAAAEQKASVIHAETTKRSFIGSSRKAD